MLKQLSKQVFEIPQTGDESSLALWIGLGAVALGGLVAMIIIRIKQKKKDDIA